MEFRVAIVGCGRIAVRHSELLGNNHIDGAKLVGVCDVSEKKAALLGAKYGVSYFLDMHVMMKSLKPDLVVVLTESGKHPDHVCALAPYGANIIVEKPMALALNDADRMISACKKNNVELFVVKQNRFNVPVQKLKSVLEKNHLGKVFLGTVRVRWCRTQEYYNQADWRGTWAMDGGVLTNQASHHVDLLQWILGPVESVFGMSTTALADIETEDTLVANIRFKSGALGVIEATTAARPKDLEGSLSILGEKGTLEIGGFAVNEVKTWSINDQHLSQERMLEFSSNPPNVYGYGHSAYYESIIACLRGERENSIDGHEGRKSLEIINAIYSSIENKCEIKVGVGPSSKRLGQVFDVT